MADNLSLTLVDKGLVTKQLVLTIGYDAENLRDENIRMNYKGETVCDRYGRQIPKHAHGTANLERYTSSAQRITAAMTELFDRITDPALLVRRVTVVACNIISEQSAAEENAFEQISLFDDASDTGSEEREKREKNMQQAILKMKRKYGKNAVLRGMNLEEGATAISRNGQIGGHKA